MTYWRHLQDPRTFRRDLGLSRFLRILALFLLGLLNVLFTPFLWIFWCVRFRLIDVGEFGLSASATSALGKLFI